MTGVEPACPDGVPGEVWAYVLRYRPRNVATDVWEQVRPFVLEVTGKFAPGTQDAARTTLSTTTSLWAWAVRTGLRLDPEKVLTPDRVARYVEETFRGRPPGSETTTRGRLGSIGRAATRRAPWPGRPTVIPRTPPAGPYLPAEMTGYRRAAAAQRFASTRRA